MGNCCKPRNQAKDGTGISKWGEESGAFHYYKAFKQKLVLLNLQSVDHRHKSVLEKGSRVLTRLEKQS